MNEYNRFFSLFSTIVLVSAAFFFTSCKKSWTCECETTHLEEESITRDSHEIKDDDGESASSTCEANNEETELGFTICSIK